MFSQLSEQLSLVARAKQHSLTVQLSLGLRIETAGSRSKVSVPIGAQIVNAGGKVLMPRSWDMRAHLVQAEHAWRIWSWPASTACRVLTPTGSPAHKLVCLRATTERPLRVLGIQGAVQIFKEHRTVRITGNVSVYFMYRHHGFPPYFQPRSSFFLRCSHSEGPTQRKCRIVGVEIPGIGRSHEGSFPVLVVVPSRLCREVVTNVDSDVGQRLVVIVLK